MPKESSNRNLKIIEENNLKFQDFEVSIDFRDITSIEKLRSFSIGGGLLAG